MQAVLLYFASYLRNARKVSYKTIDSYITHVSVMVLERGLPEMTMRGCQLRYLLAVWKRERFSSAYA